MATPVFFLIAGEASGDALGARLMWALKTKLGGDVQFMGVGGPLMQEAGLELLFPHTELMHFGVIEVLRHIPRLLGRINEAAEAVIRTRPSALITIDSPDFCFRVARKVRAAQTGVPLIHYVAPTVWAWRPGRAKKIAAFLDHLLAVLPFEPPYFTREGLDCTFVGHSVVEDGADHGIGSVFRAKRSIAPDAPLLTVLFGSRTSEIARLMPIFKRTVEILKAKHPALQLAVPTVPHLKDRVAAEVATWGLPVHIVEDRKDKYDAFAASRAALACSGTVALELALARLPAVIAYKVNSLTALMYRRFIRVAFVNLVNIMHGKGVVPEFLQDACEPEGLARTLDALLTDEWARQEQIAQLAMTAQWLGQGQFTPSARAADVVLDIVKKAEAKAGLSTEAHPPTVLQVLPALVTGGVERGTVETTAALVQAGFRALVASAGGPMVHDVTAAGGTHVLLPLASKNPLTIHANIARLEKLIADEKVDLVHARSRAPAWSAYAAAKRTNTPFVTTFHNAYGAGSALKRFYNGVMAKGARVIAISDFVAAYAEKVYGVSRDILRVIHRGVDCRAFDPQKVDPARVATLRQTWKLREGAPVILLPGRLTRWKGHDVFIRALAEMDRRDFMAVIVGGGKDNGYAEELGAQITREDLAANVIVVDTCRDMPAAYRLADAVVVPSTRPEGFGRVVVEAQAMGTPVIASDHGGAKETIVEGETGWLTPVGDATALARALERVLALNPQARQAYAARAITHIRAHFTTAAMTAKTIAVYRELLRRRP